MFTINKIMDLACLGLVRLDVDGMKLITYDIHDYVKTYFLDGVDTLNVRNNYLKSLPRLPNSIRFLFCDNNQLQSLPKLPKYLYALSCANNQLQIIKLRKRPHSLDCSGNPIIFIAPLPGELRPVFCDVPKHLISLHSYANYPKYCNRYVVYFYLITFLILDAKISPVIVNNKHFWFPGEI